MKLFRDDLRERCSDILAHLRLARVNRDLAVFADVEPGGDVARDRLATAPTAPTAARLLLCPSGIQQVKYQDSATQRFQESAAV